MKLRVIKKMLFGSVLKHLKLLLAFFAICCCCFVDKDDKASLDMILSFFTGADSVPPLGYRNVLSFNHMSLYPTASTCAVELTLPTRHQDYNNLNVIWTVHLLRLGGLDCIKLRASFLYSQ